MNNWFLLEKYVPLDKQKMAKKRLEDGEPIQYIIGNVDFCGNRIDVDERVLIPRFETETLVDKTIGYAKRFQEKIKIIDIGTGSGCIAISLAKALYADVIAIDISNEALSLAKENAKRNDVDITFLCRDMNLPLEGKYDIIISNPPYIPIDGFVSDQVKKYEPHLALYTLDNGIYFYKKILSYAFLHLNAGGFIAFEIGDHQKELLEDYIIQNFKEKKYSFEKDLAGMDRYLFLFNE